MDASVTLENGMRFVGVSDTGHEVYIDSDFSVGGNDSASRPMELILMGLCGCTAMDVISILRKKRQDVNGLQVKAHANREANHPKVFTEIELTYIVSGKNIDEKAVERAVQLSTERYCPAHAMFEQVADITTTIEINETE